MTYWFAPGSHMNLMIFDQLYTKPIWIKFCMFVLLNPFTKKVIWFKQFNIFILIILQKPKFWDRIYPNTFSQNNTYTRFIIQGFKAVAHLRILQLTNNNSISTVPFVNARISPLQDNTNLLPHRPSTCSGRVGPINEHMIFFGRHNYRRLTAYGFLKVSTSTSSDQQNILIDILDHWWCSTEHRWFYANAVRKSVDVLRKWQIIYWEVN